MDQAFGSMKLGRPGDWGGQRNGRKHTTTRTELADCPCEAQIRSLDRSTHLPLRLNRTGSTIVTKQGSVRGTRGCASSTGSRKSGPGESGGGGLGPCLILCGVR